MIPFRDDVPAKHYPIVTVGIILVNISVFVYQLTLPPEALERLVFQYGMIPSSLTTVFLNPLGVAPSVPTSLVTSMFLHGGFLHLIGNMWYLWIFGDNVEDRMGPVRFLLFYLVSGIAAGVLHILVNPDSALPSIGASGAVAGVLGAYLVSFPFARVLTIIPLLLIWPILELPAILVLGSWFFVQILNGTAAIIDATQTTGGIAWWAHIGGFVAGLLLIRRFSRQPRRYST